MKGLTSLNAKEILDMNEPSQLFTNDEKKIRDEYKELLKKWHPDNCKDEKVANDVTSKITLLYDKGVEQINKGIWIEDGVFRIESKEGKKYIIRYLDKGLFELGEYYISESAVMYILDGRFKEMFNREQKALSKLRYHDSKMEKEFKRYLPEVKVRCKTVDGRYLIVYGKTKELVKASTLLNYYKGKVPDRHVAWMISRLCNLASFMQFNGIVFNGFILDNLYVSPEYHTIVLLGGWWYTEEIESKLKYLPRELFNLLGVKDKGEKVCKTKLDLLAIKQVGRVLLGDKLGNKLRVDKNVPEEFRKWLLGAPEDNAYKEFDSWGRVLEKSYGERKFIPMEIDYSRLYK